MSSTGKVLCLYCGKECELKARRFLRRLESSLHFKSPDGCESSSTSVEDLIRNIEIAVEGRPSTLPSSLAFPSDGSVDHMKEDEETEGRPMSSPPAYQNPRLSRTGEVLASAPVQRSASNPKRIRQLKKKIRDDSNSGKEERSPVLISSFQDEGMDGRLESTEDAASSSQDAKASVTFAALPIPDVAPSSPFLRDDIVTKPNSAAVLGKHSEVKASVKARRTVSWGEDTAFVQSSNEQSSVPLAPNTITLKGSSNNAQKAGMLTAGGRKTTSKQLVGEVKESMTTKAPRALPIPSLPTHGRGIGLIEGYNSVSKRPLASLPSKAKMPPASHLSNERSVANNDNDIDDDAAEGEDEEDDESKDSGSDQTDAASEDDFSSCTPLSLFSKLWLVSDGETVSPILFISNSFFTADLFGMFLPLNILDVSSHNKLTQSSSELTETLRRSYPDLMVALSTIESQMERLWLSPENVRQTFLADLRAVQENLQTQFRTLPLTCTLTTSEWTLMALLLVDGLLRRRKVFLLEGKLKELLMDVGGSDIKLSDREIFHLRGAFFPLEES